MGRSEFQLPSSWDNPTPGAPAHYEDRTFTGRVVLDGGSFERCRFQRATLIYSGGVPPQIANCAFAETTFEFQGAAGRTLGFLQAMAAPSSGLSAIFKASFARLFGH